MRQKTVIEFDDAQEAGRYACAYYAVGYGSPAYTALVKEFGGADKLNATAAAEAARVFASNFAVRFTSPATPRVQSLDPEPTYTNTHGKTTLVRDMASSYITNALRRYPTGMPVGLRKALHDELQARTDRDGFTREFRA